MKEDDTNKSVAILKAGRSHAEAIVDLLLAAWVRTYPNEQLRISEVDVRKKFGDINAKAARIGNFLHSIESDTTYLIAELGGIVSGILYATKKSSDLYISALYIHPDYQRSGIGGALLREGIAANHGISSATVDVVSYNEQAIAFYKKHDFVILGSSVTPFGQFPNGIVVPEIRMIKNCITSDNALSV